MEGLKTRNIGTGIHFLASHTHRWYRENRPGEQAIDVVAIEGLRIAAVQRHEHLV
jgi:hypothetical protein